jgi:quercetin dioxygenase-like cupin family protein
MTRFALRLATALVCFGAIAAPGFAQQIKRQLLQDTAVPNCQYKAVLFTAELPPHSRTGRHTHPGIEVGMVLGGVGSIIIDGQSDLSLKSGDSYQIPAGVVHDVFCDGDEPFKLIGTWVVEKDKPMSTKIDH